MKKKRIPRAVEAKQQPPKLNPFEMKSSKKKFNVLGKRDKQGKQNVIKSREEAVNKRKKTLLVEYKQLRKANTFIDRRFGEDDPRLDDEDKALARFQAQRIREAKKAAKFHLTGDGGSRPLDTLTHGGRSLEELEELNSQPAELLGDMDDDILEDLVQQYHFGGGAGEEAAAGDEADGQQKKKTKKEIMEEIIAKSKAAKAEKARQKEADEAALAQLDETFKSLVTNTTAGLGALVKPPGYEKGRKLKADTEEDAAYDRATRELVFEAKGQAGERSLTAEELQEKEAARLAALEAARLKRMREDDTSAAAADGDDAADGDHAGDDDEQRPAAVGGYAAKRARLAKAADDWENRQQRRLQASGDALDENFALSDEEQEDGSGSSDQDDEDAAAATNSLEARRQSAAAGDHPLQKAFRQAAAKLAAKYGAEQQPLEEDSDGDEADDSGDAGEQESSEVGEEEDDSDDSRSGQEGEEQHQDGLEPEHPTKKHKQLEQQAKMAAALAASKLGSTAKAAAAAVVDGPLDLSFTPSAPESYQEFVSLVGGRPADQLQLAIQRIRTFNAAAMATNNKRKLQVFYGILVQHFAMLAGDQPTPAAHLDVLTHNILQLTPKVPFYAATVARTRIEKLHDRLAAHLADPLAAGPLLGWPGPRQLLQLRLFSCLFPTSDKRHPVTTPLALLLGKCLVQCPVTSPYQAAIGLLVAGMALHNTAAAARFCPEVVNHLAATLRAFVPVTAAAGAAGEAGVDLFSPGVLAFSCCSVTSSQQQQSSSKRNNRKKPGQQQQHLEEQQGGQQQQQQQLPSIQLYHLLSSSPAAAEFQTDKFRLQLLGCAVLTAQRVCQLSKGVGDAAPEVLSPLATAASAVAGLQGLPTAAAAAVGELQQQLRTAMDAVVAARLPVVQTHRVKLVAPKEYNPRYEADFSLAANYDPDRQRAAAQKLKRQLTKEKRGAMRELRRDATFMSAERDAEKARTDAERLASEKAFYNELQVQEADAKSGGQKGMNPHRKKSKK